MEFYVVDPKNIDFPTWASRVRNFLEVEGLSFTEEDGGLYYIGDDVAAPWAENSVLFTIDDEELGGIIEVRDIDQNFYVFSDDLGLFSEREIKDAVGLQGRRQNALYGFRVGSSNGCRFHHGPSAGLHFFCEDQEADYPHAMALEDVWNLCFRVINWLSDCTSRIQDFKKLNVEKVQLDFVVEADFTHSSSLDPLMEILSDEDNPNVTSSSGIAARFQARDLAWIRRFVKALPPEESCFKKALFQAEWWGTLNGTGPRTRIFYAGVEKRALRPFVQLPVHRTSKKLVERFRAHFKGHRVDRQEYYLDLEES